MNKQRPSLQLSPVSSPREHGTEAAPIVSVYDNHLASVMTENPLHSLSSRRLPGLPGDHTEGRHLI
eukprot:gene18365-13201_t